MSIKDQIVSNLEQIRPALQRDGGDVEYVDYDVGLDGRFLMIEPEKDDESSDVVVVFNWFEELKRKFSEN